MGVSSFGATADVAARMMIKYFGIDPEKEMKIITLGTDRTRFAALKEEVVLSSLHCVAKAESQVNPGPS